VTARLTELQVAREYGSRSQSKRLNGMGKRDKILEIWQSIYLLVNSDYADDREFHRSVQDISKRLRVDVRTVRERLKAGQKGHLWKLWMDEQAFPRAAVLSSLYPAVEDQELLSLLRRRTRCQSLLRAIVCLGPRVPDVPTQEQWTELIERFGFAAGVYLAKTLQSGNVTHAGVGWGETVSAVVGGIEVGSTGLPARSQPLRCIATVGEMVGDKRPGPDISSSGLAERLSASINRSTAHVFALRGVAAIIPAVVRVAEISACRRMISSFSNYDAVFGEKGVAGYLDCVITSAGNLHQKNKHWRAELIKAGFSAELLDQLADIGGAALAPEANRRTSDSERLHSEIVQRSIGLTVKQYRNVASAATARGRVGVVLCCLHHNKREVVLRCLRDQLVNTLIVDASLCTALTSTDRDWKVRQGVRRAAVK
jgi:DNA-binding transcriptional regulator LsrR (DeoR family)